VWATWCEPCVAEMPDLLRVYRAQRSRGLRLVLVSGDDEETVGAAEKFLAGQGVAWTTFRMTGDDTTFINGLDKRWSGALPASFLFDGKGQVLHFWPTPITADDLTGKLKAMLPKEVLPRRRR
jgi:thiol-disulfide isomerase/thioredoxin